MKRGAVRKFMQAATLALLVLTTTAGVAGWEVLTASPAMAQPSGSGSGSDGKGGTSGSESPNKSSNPLTGIVGGLIGSGASAL